MKVLMASESMGGGVLTMIRSIATSLASEIEFAVLYGERRETPENLAEIFGPSIRLIPWRVGTSIGPRDDWAALHQLREVVRDVAPDVLHAFSSKAGALARIAFPGGGVPICYSPSGYSFLRTDVSRPARASFLAIEWLLGRTRSLTVACGVGESRLARRVSRRSMFINNFVEPPGPDLPAPEYAGTRPMRVVSVGRIAPQKDFPLFCAIASALSDSDIEFQWVGGGEIPAGCAVPANVEVTGWLAHDRTLAALAAADVYVQTSRYEGLPVTILEAQSLGLPVLATPVVGNEELIVEGENGFLCATKEAFCARLNAIQRDPQAWRILSRNAKSLAEDYAAPRVVLRWRSLYRNFGHYLERG